MPAFFVGGVLALFERGSESVVVLCGVVTLLSKGDVLLRTFIVIRLGMRNVTGEIKIKSPLRGFSYL